MTSLSQARIAEQLEFFLKGFQSPDGTPKYRSRIGQMIAEGKASITVDYDDLLSFDTALATAAIERPDAILPAFNEAAYEAVKTENLAYADAIRDNLTVRLKGLTDKLLLRGVASKYLDRLVAINGMVVRTSEVKPLAQIAAFKCPNGHLTYVRQAGAMLRHPSKCDECDETRDLELDKSNSKFTDFQVIRLQELPEELPPGQLPQSLDAELVGEIVNKARPGDRVVVTGVVRAEPETAIGRGKLTVFRTRLETNYVDVLGKEPEQVQISAEDEEEIKRIAAMPDAYEKLIQSVAPSIYGFETQKEAVLLLVVGSPQRLLPDGTTIRGDLNILMVGDPGCLVADERVVLADGAIVKIGSMGSQHLESIQTQVLTGEGRGERATATTFHVYRKQPIIEVITESGKSIKGTPNHPLLRVRREGVNEFREWRRLDELKVGDRVAVVDGFPCTITAYLDTGFAPVKRRRFGPRFQGRLPVKVTPDLAAFLGYVLGGGWVCKDGRRLGYRVVDPDVDVLERLITVTKELFGFKDIHVSTTVRKGLKAKLRYVYLCNRDVAANVSFLREKRVPDLILKSGNEVASTFLKWLYEAVGSLLDDGRGRMAVSLRAKNIELLRDVQILLLRWGIHSSIAGNSLLIKRGADIAKFDEHVGFASKRKRDLLKRMASKVSHSNRPRRQRSERIVRLVPRGYDDVYDIEVPDGHRFIANGIISHNTAKSELLKYVSRVAPRGLYTSGRGSTAAGLTAAVVKEKSGLMMLEAGAVVLADQGVACLHPETQVIFNRTVVRVKDLADKVRFEPVSSKGELMEVGVLLGNVLSLDPRKLEVHETETTLLRRKRFKGRLKVLRFKTGNSVRLTPDHMLIDGGTLEWRRTETFKPGDFVAAPLNLPLASARVDLWDALPDEAVVSLNEDQRNELHAEFEGLRGESIAVPHISKGRFPSRVSLGQLKAIARSAGVEAKWRSRALRYWDTTAKTSFITPAMGYVVGFILGGGRLSPKKNRGVSVALSRPSMRKEYVERFSRCWKSCFEESLSMKPSARTAKPAAELKHMNVEPCGWRSTSKALYHICRYLTGEKFTRLLAVPDDVLAGFVAGLVDSAGRLVEEDRAEEGGRCWKLEIALGRDNDEDSNLNLALALRRFGCRAYVRSAGQRGSRVYVAGGRDVELLAGALDLSARLRRLVSPGSAKTPSPQESPCRRDVVELMSNAYLRSPSSAPPESGIWSVRYLRPDGRGQLGILQLQKVVEVHGRLVGEDCTDRLRVITKRDYFLDQVSSIGEEEYDGYVYDLYVPMYHNFTAAGIFVENCIDEFDKMRPEDRGVLHEVMEQQSASVAKGGIVATLNARTSILAAANPVLGKYDPYKNIYENVNLPTPLLTRFDLIFIIRDIPDRAKDEKLASHILETHREGAFVVAPPLGFDMLRKYLIYAKKLEPALTREAEERLLQFYLDLRDASTEGTITVTPRQLEALVRISTARARLLLRDKVTVEDALQAISLMRKMLETVGIDVRTGKVDLGVLHGRPASERTQLEKAMEVFKQLHGPDKKPVEAKAFADELVKTGDFSAEEARRAINTLYKLGQIYEIRTGYYSKIS
jgi:DNA replicative helicase MCM subunit Mcm2 (Cdc46/Mcm family)